MEVGMKVLKWSIIVGFVLFGAGFGGTLIWVALEHADILQPAIPLRPEFAPTTKHVVKELFAGMSSLIVCWLFAWSLWRYGN